MSGAICPSCGASLKTKPELAGRQVRCPKCSRRFTLPPAKAEAPRAEEVPLATADATPLPPVATPVVSSVPPRATPVAAAIPPLATPVASPGAMPVAPVINSTPPMAVPPMAVPLATPIQPAGLPQVAIDAAGGGSRATARAGKKVPAKRRRPSGPEVMLKMLVLLVIFLAAAGLVVLRLQARRAEFPIGLILVTVGAFAIGGALFEWSFFFQHRKARFMVSLLGQGGARVFYGLVGAGFCLVGFLELGGVIEIKNADDAAPEVQREVAPAAVVQPFAQTRPPSRPSLGDRAGRRRGPSPDRKPAATDSPPPQPEQLDDGFTGTLPSFGGEAAIEAMPASND